MHVCTGISSQLYVAGYLGGHNLISIFKKVMIVLETPDLMLTLLAMQLLCILNFQVNTCCTGSIHDLTRLVLTMEDVLIYLLMDNGYVVLHMSEYIHNKNNTCSL